MPARFDPAETMFGLDDVVIFLAAAAATCLWGLLRQRWSSGGANLPMPETVQVEMSLTDQEMIQKSQELIHQKFGGNPAECLRFASAEERTSMLRDFARELAVMYGLDDVEVDVYNKKSLNEWGYYSWRTKQARFNVFALSVKPDDPQYIAFVREVLDTICHELRHAVQHKSIRSPGFWNISEERSIAWAENMTDYIPGSKDFKAYTRQPVEADAATFAAQVVSGVHGL